MVEYTSDLDQLFQALADPTRRAILTRLSEGPATIGNLARPLDMSFAGASKHVDVLVKSKLVDKRKVGRQQICRLNAEPMRELRDWLNQYSKFWSARLDALELAIQEYDNDRS